MSLCSAWEQAYMFIEPRIAIDHRSFWTVAIFACVAVRITFSRPKMARSAS